MTASSISLRSALAMLVFAGIIAVRVEPQLLRLPFMDRAPLERHLTQLPDKNWGGYRVFLDDVREHTQPGDSIVVIVPVKSWDVGYSYAYYRASYVLSGRVVLPMMLADNVIRRDSVMNAKYAAVWGMPLAPGQHIVFRGHGGALVGR